MTVLRAATRRASLLLGISLTCATLAVLAGHAVVTAEAQFTKADSDAFQRKLDAILQQGGLQQGGGVATTAKAVPARDRQTTISEREVNAYLHHALRGQVPAGVTEPTVTILGEGKLVGTAVVDLDAVRQSRTSSSSSWFDPVRLLTGKMPVTASGTLQTQQGTGRFVLESADISGVPVPKAVLQQVVSYYSRSTENPSGVNLDDAFALPARIREIRVQTGQAVVVQ